MNLIEFSKLNSGSWTALKFCSSEVCPQHFYNDVKAKRLRTINLHLIHCGFWSVFRIIILLQEPSSSYLQHCNHTFAPKICWNVMEPMTTSTHVPLAVTKPQNMMGPHPPLTAGQVFCSSPHWSKGIAGVYLALHSTPFWIH